jgi:hypothetical protein
MVACVRADWREVQQIEIYRPVSEMSREEIAARLQIEVEAEQNQVIGSGRGGDRGNGNVVPMRRRSGTVTMTVWSRSSRNFVASVSCFTLVRYPARPCWSGTGHRHAPECRRG